MLIEPYSANSTSKITPTTMTHNETISIQIPIKKPKNDSGSPNFEPMPYLRGLVSQLEGDIGTIKFDQPKRKFGETKNTIEDFNFDKFVKSSINNLFFSGKKP